MLMTWVKRILGFAVASAAGYVGKKYGPTAGGAVGIAGGAVLHQVEKFGKK